MATSTVQVFARRVLTATTSTVQYTVPASTTAVLTSIILVNSVSGVNHATVYLDGIVLLPNVSIPGNSVLSFDMRQVLTTGKTITAGGDTTVYLHASGVEIT